MEVIFIILALVCLFLVTWRRHKASVAKIPHQPALAQPDQPTALQETPSNESDVAFRAKGERGNSGSIYGDVLCSDGVYLPQVWESDFHTSFDGRWIRTGSYGDATPRLVDRKKQRSWLLSTVEAALVDDLHWRLPHWNGESVAGNGVSSDRSTVMSDADFETWLRKHVEQPAQALVSVCDLWIPSDCVPENANVAPPSISQPSEAVIQLGVQRYWPTSLRRLLDPLEPVKTPYWQLILQGEPHSWVIAHDTDILWRADGKAFACYGYPAAGNERSPQLRLGVWSVEHGGQQWSKWQPDDHKSWKVDIQPIALKAISAQSGAPLLWEDAILLQRAFIDIPLLERLHDGRTISSATQPAQTCIAHRNNGLPLLKNIPQPFFYWRRDLQAPSKWQAQSQPVDGQPLIWTLVQESGNETGDTAAYSLQWGTSPMPGLWELEHVVVQGQWAILIPWGTPAERGGNASPWIWDGKQLHALDIRAPLARLRAMPNDAHAELIVLAGRGPDSANYTNTGLWRWPLQPVNATNADHGSWRAAYEIRAIAANKEGQWALQPRWREVHGIQHPCADGDYTWHTNDDAIWWWGGIALTPSNTWKLEQPRCEGVLVTHSGAVMCAVGPSICPHPTGDGWLVLEYLAHSQGEPHYWKLHWLRPKKHEVRTMELRAYLPSIQEWNAQQGILWQDDGVPEPNEMPAKQQLIPDIRWEDAHIDLLKQSTNGLWMRKQDAVYAETIALRSDCPWNWQPLTTSPT